VADLRLDLLSHKVTCENQNIPVQTTEYRLLEYLKRHANQVVSRVMSLKNLKQLTQN